MRVLCIAFCMTFILLTGCASSNNDAAEKNSRPSESQEASSNTSTASISDDEIDLDSQGKVDNEYIVQAIMKSEIVKYIGKTEAKIDAKYGAMQNEGEWYNGLLYTKHKNFSGSFGYWNADPGAVTERIESDSICYMIAFKLSEVMPISNNTFNKDDLKFVNDESEGDYYYIFEDNDVPIHIDCDENGNIKQDPWISVYQRANDSLYNARLKKEELQLVWQNITIPYGEIVSNHSEYEKTETDMGIYFKNDTFEYEYPSKSSEEQPTSITILKNCDDQFIGPRGIRIGDTFAQTLAKFPQEKDWEANKGLFYGDGTNLDVNRKEMDGGEVCKGTNGDIKEIVLTTKDYNPLLVIYFKNNVVTKYTIIQFLLT